MQNEERIAQRFLEDKQLPYDNCELITMALTHPSYAQEKDIVANNQRLEFLGDAVLNLVVAEYLYNHYGRKAEGELTKIRAKVVCEDALAIFARDISLGQYLLLGRGEEMSGGRRRKSILADAVEAVIAAIYLDQGLECVKSFIIAQLEGQIIEAASGDYYDYKSKLQELVQAKDKENVYYAIVEESGPAHAKVFVAEVYYRGQPLAAGEGKSKKTAEQKAAQKVLQDKALLRELGF